MRLEESWWWCGAVEKNDTNLRGADCSGTTKLSAPFQLAALLGNLTSRRPLLYISSCWDMTINRRAIEMRSNQLGHSISRSIMMAAHRLQKSSADTIANVNPPSITLHPFPQSQCLQIVSPLDSS